MREFAAGTPELDAIRAELSPHLAKVSFPAAELEPGRFVADSDEIIAYFAADAGRDPASLPLLRRYVDGPLKQIMTLWQENQGLKGKDA